MRLKGPLVLTILDHRMTKANHSFGLYRVIHKLFLQAMSGDLPNGELSTTHFFRTCERITHMNLEAFAQHWVYGAGYPILRVTQRYNKKKFCFEIGIRQVQATETSPIKLTAETFMDAASIHLALARVSQPQPLFTVSRLKSD